MISSLSNLVSNLSELIHRTKCKFGDDDRKYKKCESCIIKYKSRDCFLEYIDLKDDLKECKCLLCNKNFQREFQKK